MCQFWMWFSGSKRYFHKSNNIPKGIIKKPLSVEQSLSWPSNSQGSKLKVVCLSNPTWFIPQTAWMNRQVACFQISMYKETGTSVGKMMLLTTSWKSLCQVLIHLKQHAVMSSNKPRNYKSAYQINLSSSDVVFITLMLQNKYKWSPQVTLQPLSMICHCSV